ncbi:D-alanyl-D-alanine carboxypeptidase/D-alanyl-D-alanine-endopeptidase [bacterium]|nr:D-alanyl-D-alanine carboxypeptidase/D-alanyl-D-alanine-endopeptidase [bacterium]
MYSRQADKFMQPGSLVQLFTAAAALDLLGPDYQFTTEIGYAGQIDNQEKTLTGSIVIRSNGDPSLSSQYMSEAALTKVLDGWVGKIKDQKIKKVTGAVVADARAFDNDWYGPGWPMQRIGAADLPSISAVNFNNNVLDITYDKIRKPGKAATCKVFPDIGEYLFFANHVKTAENMRRERVYKRVEQGNLISVGGDLPVKTAAHDRAAIEDPGRFFAEALKQRLIENGVKVEGKGCSSATVADDAMPSRTTVLDRRRSAPLSKIVDNMLRNDSALEAEVLLKAMGMKADGQRGNFESGRAARSDYLGRQLLLPHAPTRLFDGSGRSAFDRLTAENVIDLMRRASRQENGARFVSFVPHAGEGVLAGRFDSRAPLHAVVTSSEGLEAIAGWTESPSGNGVYFVIMVNGSRAPAKILRGQIERIVLDLTHIGEAGHP